MGSIARSLQTDVSHDPLVQGFQRLQVCRRSKEGESCVSSSMDKVCVELS